MCIYYGNKENLTYKKQEHVIPAGLGCHTKLARGVVSDQANEYFSPLERNVLEKSFLMVNRVIEGPGKRGKTSEKYATTSEVSVVCHDGLYCLGIMKGTQGFILTQFIIDGDNGLKFMLGTDDTNAINLEKLANLVVNMKDKYVSIIDEELGDRIFITHHKGKITIGSGAELTADRIQKIKDIFFQELVTGNSTHMDGQIELKLEVEHNFVSVCKVVAKTAINTVAYILGEEFLYTNNAFEKIISSIMNDNESILNIVYGLKEADYFRKKFHLNAEQPVCLLINEQNKLDAFVFFYSYGFQMTLCENVKIPFLIEGIVCDWKETKKDYKYTDYLKFIGVFQ